MIKSNKEETFMRKMLFDKPLVKLILLMLIDFLISNFGSRIPDDFLVRWFILALNILIAIYFVITIIYVVRRSYHHLMNPKNLFALIGAYALLIIIILTIFSTLFSFIELTKIGYIKYGVCEDNFSSNSILTDPEISRDFFYFSAMTFFTVGYGDICPMGFAKTISIFAAFIGHIFSVMLVALIINNYLRMKNK